MFVISQKKKLSLGKNIYAKTKYDGEKNILKVNSNALIIRTNFFGWGPSYKNSFSDFILNNLENNINIIQENTIVGRFAL